MPGSKSAKRSKSTPRTSPRSRGARKPDPRRAKLLANLVRRLLLDGHTAGTIQDAALAGQLAEFEGKAPTLEEFTAALEAARTTFEDATDESSASLVGWTLEASRKLYADLVEVGDFAGALRAVDQVRKGAETKEKLNL